MASLLGDKDGKEKDRGIVPYDQYIMERLWTLPEDLHILILMTGIGDHHVGYEGQFSQVCLARREKVLDWLVPKPRVPSKKDVLENLFSKCCETHDAKFLEKLTGILDITIDSTKSTYISTALIHGNMSAVAWFESRESKLNYSIIYVSSHEACNRGYPQVLEYIHTKYPEDEFEKYMLFLSVCNGGHLNTMEWMLTTYPDTDVRCNYDYAYRTAVVNGRVEIVKFLEKVCPALKHME